MRQSLRTSLILIAFFCSACSGKNNPVNGPTNVTTDGGQQSAPDSLISCADWYRAAMPGSENVLVNNVWNKQHAGSYAYKQCLARRNTDAGLQYGWTWDWPRCDTSTSYGSPEVVFGRKPWDGGVSTSAQLPKSIDAIASLQVDFGVQINADPCYNLNTTLWLTQTAAAPTAPDPENIVAEVMVRFGDPAHISGCCTADGAAHLGNMTFDVYHQDAHADASGGSSYTWKMVTYVARTTRHDTQFDLALVLRDMVSKGLASSTHGVQGVELITEVSGGKGQLWLERFRVNVE